MKWGVLVIVKGLLINIAVENTRMIYKFLPEIDESEGKLNEFVWLYT